MEYLVVLTILLCSLYTRKLENLLPPPSSEISLAILEFVGPLIGQVYCLTHQDSDGQGADNAGTIYVVRTTQLELSFCPVSHFYQLYEDKGRLFLSLLMLQLWNLMAGEEYGSMVAVVTLAQKGGGE